MNIITLIKFQNIVKNYYFYHHLRIRWISDDRYVEYALMCRKKCYQENICWKDILKKRSQKNQGKSFLKNKFQNKFLEKTFSAKKITSESSEQMFSVNIFLGNPWEKLFGEKINEKYMDEFISRIYDAKKFNNSDTK